MSLLAEYALTPDVFDVDSYSSEEVCAVHVQTLKDVLLHEAVVRNLYDGNWARLFADTNRGWHKRAKELLKKLGKQNRLVRFPAQASTPPSSDPEWCVEALASHTAAPLSGIIVTDVVAGGFTGQAAVSAVHKLPTASWWSGRKSSLRLARTLPNYAQALDLVARYANSIMYIDPYLDPTLGHYRDFAKLLVDMGAVAPSRLVELHRVAWRGSSQDKRPVCDEIERAFCDELTGPVRKARMRIEVFLWDDFHDRYLISDLVGIQMSNGFDTTQAPNSITTWSRLGRADRDDVQREFDRASTRHRLCGRFEIQ